MRPLIKEGLLTTATVLRIATVTGRLATIEEAVNDSLGTAYAGVHRYRAEITVHGAGPAFHA
jgi:hypothetical protein